MDLKTVVSIVLTVLGAIQGLYIFFKGRNDRRESEARAREDKLVSEQREVLERRMSDLETEVADHIKEDREMHERVQKAETRLDGVQQQINDANARHGDLVKKLDDIQKAMLTKDDFKMLVDVIRNPSNG